MKSLTEAIRKRIPGSGGSLSTSDSDSSAAPTVNSHFPSGTSSGTNSHALASAEVLPNPNPNPNGSEPLSPSVSGSILTVQSSPQPNVPSSPPVPSSLPLYPASTSSSSQQYQMPPLMASSSSSPPASPSASPSATNDRRRSNRLSSLLAHLPVPLTPTNQSPAGSTPILPATANSAAAAGAASETTTLDSSPPGSSDGHRHRSGGERRSILAHLPLNRGPSPLRTVRTLLHHIHGNPEEKYERDACLPASETGLTPAVNAVGISAGSGDERISSSQRSSGRAVRKERREKLKAERQAAKEARESQRERTRQRIQERREQYSRGMSVKQTDRNGNVTLHLHTLPINNYAAGSRDVGAAARDNDTSMESFSRQMTGEEDVSFRARIHTVRRIGKGLQFVVLRQGASTMQAVLFIDPPHPDGRSGQSGSLEANATSVSVPTDSANPLSPVQAPALVWSRLFLTPETIVNVRGRLVPPANKSGSVNTTIRTAELVLSEIGVVSHVEHLPFTVNQAEKSNMWRRDEEKREGKKRKEEAGDRTSKDSSTDSSLDSPSGSTNQPIRPAQAGVVSGRVRAENRVLDLRTEAARGIFRVQSTISHYFRTHLHSLGFLEIHTPKLQGAATESGSSVFRVDYFGRPAFLAQSPQLAKQLAISADFRRVFEIGPVFRAENSNTHRHLTEFTGLDLEMEIDNHYHEVLDVLDSTFKAIFEGVYRDCRNEIEAIKRRYPHEDIVWLEETPRFRFADAIKMLNESGWRTEEGEELKEDEDLSTRDEIQLGKLVKEKYKTDFYIIDKFPIGARPFYAMPDPEDGQVTNSFDIFLRGQEILSGGQRIHDPAMLRKRMAEHMIDGDGGMAEYLSGFKFGAPPHGGGGIGLERMLFLLLNLNDIRPGSLFPRDPRSFPLKLTDIPDLLRYPQADTRHPTWDTKNPNLPYDQLPPIEMMIANYGDAANTSWLEPRTHVWRHIPTGGLVGYVPLDGYAIIAGNPLCHASQYKVVAPAFLDFLASQSLKPIWILVNIEMESVLAKRKWRSLSVTVEQRLDPTDPTRLHDPHVMRKIKQAEGKTRFVDYDFGQELPGAVKQQLDTKVDEWLKARAGKKQVHLTDIHIDQDPAHRSTHLAYSTATGEIIGLVVLAQLAPKYGVQVKYSLDFPGSTSGTIEALLVHVFNFVARNQERITLASPTARAIEAARASNSRSSSPPAAADSPMKNLCVTFGSGATSRLVTGHNISFARSVFLDMIYNKVLEPTLLTNKSKFRQKLGTVDDPTWVCYPHRGLSYPVLLKFFGYEWEWGHEKGNSKGGKKEFSLSKGLRLRE